MGRKASIAILELGVKSGLDAVEFAFHYLRIWVKILAKGRAKWVDENGQPKLVLQIAEYVVHVLNVILMEARVSNGGRASQPIAKQCTPELDSSAPHEARLPSLGSALTVQVQVYE